MSDKPPVVIKNSAPHEVSFSEVTGKITRKVNRFNENAAAEEGNKEETLREQPGEISANRQLVAAAEQGTSTRLQGEAGEVVRSNIQRAADSVAIGNHLHEEASQEHAGGTEATQVPKAHPQTNKQHLPPASNVRPADHQFQTGKSDHTNILHEPVSENQHNTVYAESSSIEKNIIVPPPPAAAASYDTTNMVLPAGYGPADSLSNNSQTSGGLPNILHADAPGNQKNIRGIESAAETSLNRVHPDGLPDRDQNLVRVPLLGGDRASDGGRSADSSDVAIQQAAMVEHENAQLRSPETHDNADAGVADGRDRNSAMKLKISAVVEKHMHAVEEETARLNRQLEKLGNQYASLEKRHK